MPLLASLVVEPRILSIGHRGASGLTPENTKIAFFKALDLGADAIEFDVQLTRDEVVIVFHDETLDRTTDGAGRVADTDFATVRDLDAGSWFGTAFAKIEVPTLTEVLQALGKRCLINIELKPDERGELLAKHVVTEVARFDLFDSIVFSSFDIDSLSAMRRMVPGVRLGVVFAEGGEDRAMSAARRLEAESVNPEARLVDDQLIAKAHGWGFAVWAWTANDRKEIERLCNIGVDGIFSDYPDRVVAARP